MSDFMGHDTARFAPAPDDSIRELRWKVESMLEHLRENEGWLKQFPTGACEERLALWQSLADLLAEATEQPELAADAELEAHRVWGEEMRLSALVTVTMCVHARSENARRRFADDPETLETLLANLERARPAAMRLLSIEDRDQLREHGFLRLRE